MKPYGYGFNVFNYWQQFSSEGENFYFPIFSAYFKAKEKTKQDESFRYAIWICFFGVGIEIFTKSL